ncbi:hypothetical protein QZH41_015236 [Actinostola sp. cb2023]|nr:hypothetical protein QZH41_015236 [Actinostola sp. cb2023]
MKWRTATMGLMFQKILNLNPTARSKVSAGYIFNLMSGDVQRIDHVVTKIGLVLQGLIEAAIIPILIVYMVDVRALLGIVYLALLAFIYCGLGKVCVNLRNKISKVADERLGFTSAMIAGLRTVKMYTWEMPFLDVIRKLRRYKHQRYTANSENVVGDRLQAYATRPKRSMGRYDHSLACFSYLVTMAVIIIYVLLGRYFVRTSRELQRLESLNRSPVFSHVTNTMEGLDTIRNHQMQGMFMENFYKYLDTHTTTWFAAQASARWLGIRADIIGAMFSTAVIFCVFALKADAGNAALSLIYVLLLATGTSQQSVRNFAETETYMTSVERVMTYTQLEPESGYDKLTYPPSDWPKAGQLELQDVSLEYYPGAPTVLNHVHFKVDAQEKIGIAGRTGAGKSSIVSALFRMPEPQGRILIDGIDIMTINLQSSRRAMAVISQDPVLFSGTLRFNLDPFEQYSDNEVWEAIDGASLTSTIQDMPNQLNQMVKEYGVNLSSGERQLLCLARALLQKSKIIVMDEATANVDYTTDSLIQNTLRTKFKECTVITIAHRLNTIMDYDKILVLENGRVVDFDTPQALMAKDHGIMTPIRQ